MRQDKIIIIMPAYNAAKTLRECVAAVPREWADEIILVDDGSRDDTVAIAQELGLTVFAHDHNRGYGGNQKTCYRQALAHGAEIVVMVHPDHQYDPKVLPELVQPIIERKSDAVFGSRILGGKARQGGMPRWKYFFNIVLTKIENAVMGICLTEYHSGFRAYSRRFLQAIDLEANSDKFVFDSEIIAQGVFAGMQIAEVPIATRYFPDASQISFSSSVCYGLSILDLLRRVLLHRWGVRLYRQFVPTLKE